MQRVLDNPRSGERIVIRRGAADTAGRLLEFDVFLQPGAHVPAGHVHPKQQEQFRVLAGRVQFRIDGRRFLVRSGSQLTVASGTRHWFGNAGSEVAHLRVEVRPALRMEELFATTVRCADARSAVWWLRLLDWLLIPRDFEHEVNVPRLPPNLVSAVLGPLAWLRRGLRAPA
jgi:quercetin dioxygenase-like cupin family protein